jgi:hypothetical protein
MPVLQRARRNSRSFPVWQSGHSLRLAWTEMTKRASTANGRVFMYLTDRRELIAFGSVYTGKARHNLDLRLSSFRSRGYLIRIMVHERRFYYRRTGDVLQMLCYRVVTERFDRGTSECTCSRARRIFQSLCHASGWVSRVLREIHIPCRSLLTAVLPLS